MQTAPRHLAAGIALVALAVALVLTWLAPWSAPDSMPPIRRVGPREAHSTGSDSDGPQGIERRSTGSARSSSGESSERTSAAASLGPAAPRQSAQPATVTWRFFDAETGEKIKRVDVRGVSSDRFLSKRFKSGSTVVLSPGRWELALRAGGYEAVVLEPLSLEQGQHMDLKIEFPRGWASLSGVVGVPNALAKLGPFHVHLHGEGRSACACPEPAQLERLPGEDEASREPPEHCPGCGVGEDFTLRSVGPDEFFQFDGLSRGDYVVAVFDAKGRLRLHEAVSIESGESKRLDLRLEIMELHFVVTGPDGEPFDGTWMEGAQVYEAPLELYFSSEGRPCGSACTSIASGRLLAGPDGTLHIRARPATRPDDGRVLLRDVDRARTKEILGLRLLEHGGQRSAFALDRASARGSLPSVLRLDPASGLLRVRPDSASKRKKKPQDQRRKLKDTRFFGAWTAPEPIGTRSLRARKLGPGRYVVRDVPREADSVLVASGPWFQTVALGIGHAGPLAVQLTERCALRTGKFKALKGCADCHDRADIAPLRW